MTFCWGGGGFWLPCLFLPEALSCNCTYFGLGGLVSNHPDQNPNNNELSSEKAHCRKVSATFSRSLKCSNSRESAKMHVCTYIYICLYIYIYMFIFLLFFFCVRGSPYLGGPQTLHLSPTSQNGVFQRVSSSRRRSPCLDSAFPAELP